MGWLEDFLSRTEQQRPQVTASAPQPTTSPLNIDRSLGSGKQLRADHPGENAALRTGPMSEDPAAILLGRGVSRTSMGGTVDSPFSRYATRRNGRLMEAHDYGSGTPVRYFARRNAGVLQAAARQALGEQSGNRMAGAVVPTTEPSLLTGRPLATPELTPQDLELVKRLLGR